MMMMMMMIINNDDEGDDLNFLYTNVGVAESHEEDRNWSSSRTAQRHKVGEEEVPTIPVLFTKVEWEISG